MNEVQFDVRDAKWDWGQEFDREGYNFDIIAKDDETSVHHIVAHVVDEKVADQIVRDHNAALDQ